MPRVNRRYVADATAPEEESTALKLPKVVAVVGLVMEPVGARR